MWRAAAVTPSSIPGSRPCRTSTALKACAFSASPATTSAPPGTLDEIKTFCSTTFGASFELFDKVHASGSTTEPYTTLNTTEPAGDVAWNFEKFLVGKDGIVINRFKSGVAPEDAELTGAIEAALKA